MSKIINSTNKASLWKPTGFTVGFIVGIIISMIITVIIKGKECLV